MRAQGTWLAKCFTSLVKGRFYTSGCVGAITIQVTELTSVRQGAAGFWQRSDELVLFRASLSALVPSGMSSMALSCASVCTEVLFVYFKVFLLVHGLQPSGAWLFLMLALVCPSLLTRS